MYMSNPLGMPKPRTEERNRRTPNNMLFYLLLLQTMGPEMGIIWEVFIQSGFV
jgi:hypothetical protein